MRGLMMTNAAHSLTQLSACCAIALAMSACVPYPHSVTRNPAIEGRVLSAETGQAVAGAKIELDIGSDESWAYETVSDAEGRFDDGVRDDLRLELGDVLWYVAQLATELDLDLADVAAANLEKLASRAARNVIAGSGDQR